MRNCQFCLQEIAEEASVCPHCTRPQIDEVHRKEYINKLYLKKAVGLGFTWFIIGSILAIIYETESFFGLLFLILILPIIVGVTLYLYKKNQYKSKQMVQAYKILIGMAIIFAISNPSPADFKMYIEHNSSDATSLSKISREINLVVFSVYQTSFEVLDNSPTSPIEHDTYLGILGNFIPVGRHPEGRIDFIRDE
jgi:hypothetical protein